MGVLYWAIHPTQDFALLFKNKKKNLKPFYIAVEIIEFHYDDFTHTGHVLCVYPLPPSSLNSPLISPFAPDSPHY